MPAIEITDAQAKALARGENITVAPERREELRNVLARTTGSKSLTLIIDGEIIGDRIYAYKYIRLLNIFADVPADVGVRTTTRESYLSSGNCWSKTDKIKLTPIGSLS